MDWDKKKLLHEYYHIASFVNNDVPPVWVVQAKQAREMERWILTKNPEDTKGGKAWHDDPTEQPTPSKKAGRQEDPAEKPTPVKKAKA